MTASIRYMPVLRTKRAELHALAKLSEAERRDVHPLLVVESPTPPKPGSGRRRPWTEQTALLDRIVDPNNGLVGCWGQSDPIAIDLGELSHELVDSAETHEWFYSECEMMGIAAIPVTGRDRSPDARTAAASAARRIGAGVCIRLRGEDLAAGAAGMSPLERELDLPRSQIDVVIDLGALPGTDAFILAAVAAQYVERAEPASGWRSLTLVGSAFPTALYTEVEYNSHELFTRTEMDIWRRAAREVPALGQGVSFGDYCMVSPIPGPPYRGAANLRYTTENQWLVMRGHQLEKAPPDDYPRLARELVHLDGWYGGEHCPGCEFIQAKADGAKGPGNSTQWRYASFVHHITVTRTQLTPATLK